MRSPFFYLIKSPIEFIPSRLPVIIPLKLLLKMQCLESVNVISQNFFEDSQTNVPGLKTSWRGLKRKMLLKTIEEGDEGWGILFFISWTKIFDEVALYFVRAVLYFLWPFWVMRAVIWAYKLIWNGLIQRFRFVYLTLLPMPQSKVVEILLIQLYTKEMALGSFLKKIRVLFATSYWNCPMYQDLFTPLESNWDFFWFLIGVSQGSLLAAYTVGLW